MARKLYFTYVSLTAAALLLGAAAFITVLHSQAKAQGTVASATALHCFVGNKMDRPNPHMTRGWVCMQSPLEVATQ